jgi:hypothetical protein
VSPATRELADDATRRCRAGVGAAARALYAGAPSRTASALRDRLESGASLWPWLPGLCYRALEPLAVGFPDDDRAMTVAGKALVGRPVRPERLAAAVRQLRGEAVDAAEAPDPDVAAAVDRFWTQLARTARHLGEAVRAGDEDAVAHALQQAAPRLRESAGAVHFAAQRGGSPPTRLVGDDPASSTIPPEPDPQALGDPGVAPPPTAGVAPGPTDDLGVDAPSSGEGEPPVGADPAPLAHTPAGTDPAWTVAGPAAGEQPPPPRSDLPAALAEEETELEPDRPYAPLIFVGGALLLAIVLLTAVASGVVAL